MNLNQTPADGNSFQGSTTPLLASPEGFVQVYVQSLFMGSHNIPSVVFLRACAGSSKTSSVSSSSPTPSPTPHTPLVPKAACTPLSSPTPCTTDDTLNTDNTSSITPDGASNECGDEPLQNMVLPIEVGSHEVHAISFYLAREGSEDHTPSTDHLSPYTLCEATLQALSARFSRFMIYEVDGTRFFAGGVLERMDTVGDRATTSARNSAVCSQVPAVDAPQQTSIPHWVETRVTDALILSRILNVPLFVSRDVFLRAGAQADAAVAVR